MKMKLDYKIINAGTWNEAKNCFDEIDQHFIFRGQSDANWDLKTSFERCYFFKKNYRVEKDFLKDFQRGAYTYADSSNLPSRNDILSWLALMQHHCAPTRLLDFTLSPYIASYFAFEKTNTDCAVWCLEKDHLKEDLGKKYPQGFKYRGDFMYDLPDNSFNKIFEENKLNCVFPVRPSVTNKRYILQQSIFVSLGNTEQTFMEQLLSYSWPEYLPEHIIKIILPIDFREEALYDLNRMNINRSTLFPDIDGFSEYLKNYYELRYMGAQHKITDNAFKRKGKK
jgi:hypothetical protein